jgi:hypothetical protein
MCVFVSCCYFFGGRHVFLLSTTFAGWSCIFVSLRVCVFFFCPHPPHLTSPHPTSPHLTQLCGLCLQGDSFESPVPAWSAVRAADKLSSYGYGQVHPPPLALLLPATSCQQLPAACPLTFAPYRLLDALACVSRRQLAIANATHLHFQFKAINGDSGDEFYLVKA